MTENEAILNIEKWYQPTTEPKEREKAIEALSVTLKCIKEITQYREIGTVEECREAMERQKAMKPKEILRHRGGFEEYHCPNCNSNFLKDERYAIKEGYCSACGKLLDSRFRNYCANCGQAIENVKMRFWRGSDLLP